MTDQEKQILKKQEFLAEVLHHCLNREPCMSLEDLAIVLVEEVDDLKEFLRVYIKQQK